MNGLKMCECGEPTYSNKCALCSADVSCLPTQPNRDWAGLMRGVRVEGDTVVVKVKGGNDAARELCGALIEEMNK